MSKLNWWDNYKFFAEGAKNGGNRKTNQKSESGAADQSNSGPGRSGSQDSTQGAKPTDYTIQGAGQGTGLTGLTGLPVNQYLTSYWFITNDSMSTYNTNMKTPSGKWCLPWMSGELGKPNAAKIWTPRPVPGYSEGIQVGEVIAWRAWYWDDKRKRLRSLFVDYEWPIDGPATGEPWNGYGLHAFKDADGPYNEYYSCKEYLVFGQCAFWGDVVEFQKGYTAEFGKVVSIHIAPSKSVKELIKKMYLR